jgi:hypothetical protein
MREGNNVHWVGTLATTPAQVERMALADQTLRIITRISIGGTRLRAHISNTHGVRPSQ